MCFFIPKQFQVSFFSVLFNIYFETNRAGQATTLPRQFNNFSGQNAIDYGISSTVYCIFVVDTTFRHRGIHIFVFFLSRKLHYFVELAGCLCREAEIFSRGHRSGK